MTIQTDIERATLAIKAAPLASLPPRALAQLAVRELAYVQSPGYRESRRPKPLTLLPAHLEAAATPADALRRAADCADQVRAELSDALSQGEGDSVTPTALRQLLKAASPQRYTVYADAESLRAAAELDIAQDPVK